MIMTIVISFHRWSMFTPITDMTFVGLDNYARLFDDSARVQASPTPASTSCLSIVITIPLAFIIAMLLYFPKLRGATSFASSSSPPT